ncbi:MAG: MFS transporter [Cryomorphaceae bacterium]|nr:MFS transporter [Cryomorphaceae bacterium]
MRFRRKRNNSKVQNAWAFYDWANSVYSLVIATAVFPIYFESVTTDAIQVFGFSVANTALYSYSLSVSFLIVAIISPLLSGLADHTGNKKAFLKFFCYLGAIACAGLGFFHGDNTVWLAIVLSMLASIGFWGSLVFYNAFLPEIAPQDRHDALSAQGFAWGYIGGALLLIFNLLMINFPTWFGLTDAGQASQVSFITVGIWWASFAQVTFRHLPGRKGERIKAKGYIWTGYSRLRKVWKMVKKMPHLTWFLAAFFMYSTGVQTVILMAGLFGSGQLNLPAEMLILTILIIQFVAIAGAYFFSFLSKILGNIQALLISIVIWSGICIAAYLLNPDHPDVIRQFFVLGGVVGLVMGGIQSLSRSTYSKMLPASINTASLFSFYDVTEKIAIVFGTFTFGLTIQLSDGDMGQSALMLAVFFLIAFLLMMYLLRFIKPQRLVPSLKGQGLTSIR